MNDENEVTQPDIKPAIDRLFSAYAETDAMVRNGLLERAVTDHVSYWTRTGVLGSRQELSEFIADWLETNKGNAPQLMGEIQSFRNVARAAWKARLKGHFLIQEGETFFELASDGRLQSIINFSDPPHHVLISSGPQAYINAWNSDTEQEKSDALSGDWADDGRWVEMRFDVAGPRAIAQTMKAPINLAPVDGVMDVMQFDGFGKQIRFEVDVTHRDGREIGRFTDFVAIDQNGKTSRLAGFKGASLSMKHKTSGVDPEWNWSYVSGYEDPNGVFAGGSEVMHLASHRGKLYAANGYWEDNHWLVPEGAPKQSAQVLRLDSPEGPWVVDLDLGAESPPDIHIMKGNILKTITFTMDGDGNKLPSPVEILLMGASNIYSTTRVWTLNDDSGNWVGQTVGSGPRKANIRWVPRDVEIYIDKVTGQERVFMLMGNIGIISGVYDPDTPSRIRWDKKVEFPAEGELEVRALGLVEANGELYFSAGRSLFKRHDGAQPTYSEILKLSDPDDDTLNVEMGGIRGLSAIETPGADEQQSLIFMWAPHGRSRGTILRLDPDGKGGYTQHEEVVIGDLIPGFIKHDISVRKVLGAYNNFYQLIDPESGERVHIFGFQTQLMGNDEIVGQVRYYKGAPYAIRTKDQQYILGEINGLFEPGKARIIGPRSFVLSPFGDNHIYTAGYDSNFVESTGMAWIFNAHRDVWLAPLKKQD